MNIPATGLQVVERLDCRTIPPARAIPDLEADVTSGLLNGRPRSLPPKYFYDAVGSQLFDRICDTAEYYPTRTEDALLERHAPAVIARVRPHHIVELGAGTARKTRRLFDACTSAGLAAAYAPFDVCAEILVESGQGLVADYDWLEVNALVGDYHAGLDHFPEFDGTCLYVFLGGTIGNFPHHEAVTFLADLRAHMGRDDRLLLGADRFKDPALLHAAYNDAAGITAAFNRNLLSVLNRELGADFAPEHFVHHACYHPGRRQVEMYLASTRRQRVTFPGLDAVMELEEGEGILTEISRKFTRDDLHGLLAAAGLVVEEHYEATERLYSLVLARPA